MYTRKPQTDWRPAAWQNASSSINDYSTRLAHAARAWTNLRTFRNRAILGVLVLLGLFILYRAVWLTSWYWPYRLLHGYLAEQLPLAAPWAIDTLALLLASLIAAQGAALLSFILWGKHRREMLALSLAGAVLHGCLGWHSHGRVAVDERGRVILRVVESPSGELKIVSHDFDPETGQRARAATEADLVMLDLQRRGIPVRRVGKSGPFRSTQGTINVYYKRRDARIVLYTGPRHPEVTGDLQRANDEILREFLRQP